MSEKNKIYFFGDSIIENCILRHSRHGNSIFEQKADVQEISKGTLFVNECFKNLIKIKDYGLEKYRVTSINCSSIKTKCYSTADIDDNDNKKVKNRTIAGYNNLKKCKTMSISSQLPNSSTEFNSDDIIILNDKGIRFFSKDNSDLDGLIDKLFVNNDAQKFIALSAKNFNFVLEKLVKVCKDDDLEKITLLFSLDECRNNKMVISSRLSWENTFACFYNAYYENRYVPYLKKFKNLISFAQIEGAVVLDNSKFEFLFLADHVEGDIINREILNFDDIIDVILTAYTIGTMLKKNKLNCAKYALELACKYNDLKSTTIDKKIFDITKVDEIIKNSSFVTISAPEILRRDWKILGLRYQDIGIKNRAIDIVKKGLEKLSKEVPTFKSGKLLSVDRNEIENYRTIKVLLDKYIESDIQKPISLAAFGPPGSGKSFGIKQILCNYKGEIVEKTINISQLNDANDLNSFFKEIGDISIQGKLPVVFFDEFDTNKFHWVKYFLAPMQDGTYYIDGQTKPLGRGIYIFAGATKLSFSQLENEVENEIKTATSTLIDAKVPDFISRLRGFIDIMGINKNEQEPDDSYLIRRAVLLRSMLEGYYPNIFTKEDNKRICNIEDELLKSFLDITKYKYGARSLEQILIMSSVNKEYNFLPSMLPPLSQLNIHVDAKEFLGDRALDRKKMEV